MEELVLLGGFLLFCACGYFAIGQLHKFLDRVRREKDRRTR